MTEGTFNISEPLEVDATSCCSDIPRNFKIVLVGDGGTGKTSYIDSLNDGNFKKEYIATVGIEKHDIDVATTHGDFKLTICDTAGQEKLGPLRDFYYEGVDAALLFFEVTSRITYKNVTEWHRDILRVCSKIPIVLCANKIDINLRKVKRKNITYHEKFKLGFYEMSVKEKIHIKEPIEYLLQQLTKEPELKIVGCLGTFVFDSVDKLNISSTDCV